MPFHDPHELSTNATAASAPMRLAILLQLRIIFHLPQRVAAALPERLERGPKPAGQV
jgi:hypothetical protein